MSAVAAEFQDPSPSPPSLAADSDGCRHDGGEGTFLPTVPFVFWDEKYGLPAVLHRARLTGSEMMAVVVMLPSAKEAPDTPGLWCLTWSEAECARRSKMSRRTIRRAKAKLKVAGLIELMSGSVHSSSAVWEVSKLVLIKPKKEK